MRRCLGSGFLAFTVDQGPDTDRYQGIVELTGDRLEDSAAQYFKQSEQLATALKLAVQPPCETQGWRATALMIQRMPLGPNSPILTAEEADEAWNRAVILMNSAKDEEMLDPALPSAQLLHRLYHGEGLQWLEPRPLRAACRCSAERVAGTLRSFPRAEIAALKDDTGSVVVVCEFCKADYRFGPSELDAVYDP